jgi:ABC-type polysaccharide/polyol phosphate export permease
VERKEEFIMIKRWMDNAEAQAAILYLYAVGIVMAVMIFIYTSPIVDTFTIFHNQYTQGANPMYPISQNLQDSIFITQWGIHDWIIVFLIVWTIAAYAAALRYRNQVV